MTKKHPFNLGDFQSLQFIFSYLCFVFKDLWKQTYQDKGFRHPNHTETPDTYLTLFSLFPHLLPIPYFHDLLFCTQFLPNRFHPSHLWTFFTVQGNVTFPLMSGNNARPLSPLFPSLIFINNLILSSHHFFSLGLSKTEIQLWVLLTHTRQRLWILESSVP